MLIATKCPKIQPKIAFLLCGLMEIIIKQITNVISLYILTLVIYIFYEAEIWTLTNEHKAVHCVCFIARTGLVLSVCLSVLGR